MKRSFFSVRLYAEGLRQLRLMGLLFTILFSLFAAIPPVMRYLDTIDGGRFAVTTVTAQSVNPLLVLVFCAVAPLMTLYLFSFLNKREGSDFYHAASPTRPCTFLSFFAAVLTWCAVVAIVSSAAGAVAYGAFPQLYVVGLRNLLFTTLGCLAGAWLVSAAVTVAMSVTGTTVMNILVALMLIFFPRALLLMVQSAIEEVFLLVSRVDFAPVLSPDYNIPFGFIYGLFMNGDGYPCLSSGASIAYTAVAAVLYTALGLWLYTRRHSEAAGRSAPNRRLQAAFRFLIGFAISCIPTFGLFNFLMKNTFIDYYDLATLVIVYGVAIAAVILFELLSVRRVRGLLRKTLSTVGCLVVANLVLFLGVFGLGRSMFLFAPDADDIDSVSILDSVHGDIYYGGRYTDYFAEKSAEIELDDPVIRQLVSEQLKHTLDLLDISRGRYESAYSQARSITFAIRAGGITRYRSIFLYPDDIEQLTARLYDDMTYRSVFNDLPTKVSHIETTDMKTAYMYMRKPDEVNALYEQFRAEIATLPYKQWFELANGRVPSDDTELCSLRFEMETANGFSRFTVPLIPSLLPKTTTMILRSCNEQRQADHGLSVLASEFSKVNTLTFTIYGGERDGQTVIFDKDTPADVKEQIATWLHTATVRDATKTVSTNGIFFFVQGYVDRVNQHDGDYYQYTEENYAYVMDESGQLPEFFRHNCQE